MRTKLLLFLLLLTVNIAVVAQRQGNEWIDYNQTYFKIKTGSDDIHRLTPAALQTAGIDLNTLNLANLQLFHRGNEVAIHIEDGGDGVLDGSDFIEFYGRRNDGTQDTELFYRAADQIHKYYNLFSDTTSFFLTESSLPGLRMEEVNIDPSPLTQVSLHTEEILNVQTNKFSFGQYYDIGNPTGEVKRSLYDRGQMFMSREIMYNDFGLSRDLNFLDVALNGINLQDESQGKPQLTVQIVGFNNVQHRASVYVGPDTDNLRLVRRDVEILYSNFGTVNTQIEWSDVANGRVIVRVEVLGSGDPNVQIDDRIAVGFITLKYPQQIDAQSQDKRVYLNPATGNQGVSISNVDGDVRLYDISDYRSPKRISGQLAANTFTAGVTNDANGKTLFLKRADGIVEPSVEPVTFKFQNLSPYNYYIISHPYLKQPVEGLYDDPVQAYVDYRSSVEGGTFNVLYADAPDLYDEFGYGEFTPLAIRRFMVSAYAQGVPEYLFIIGKSSRVDIRSQRLSDPLATSRRELVPTMGAPGSDIMYVEALDGRAHFPAFPVGRLSVTEPANVAYYLDKAKEKEATLKDSPWTKNFIQLSGGLNTNELNRFRFFIDKFKDVVEDDYLGAAVTNLSKSNNNAVQNFNISEQINKGTGFVTFFGHSSARFTDIDIGNVTDPNSGYDNKGRYPVFIVNGCRGGEIFFFSSFGENWIGAQDKGAVNFLAHSDVGIPNVLEEYTENFYEVMSDTLYMTQSIGKIQQQTILRQLNGFLPDEADFAAVEQTVLQGDPALQVFAHDKVDYIVREEDIFRESIDGRPITSTTQFFNLGVVINNAGRTTTEPVTVTVRRTLSDGRVLELPEIEVPAIRNRDTVYYEISNQGLDVFGENKFEVFLDLENKVDEGSELNNTAESVFFFTASGTFNTAPANFSTISETDISLVLQSSDLKVNDKTFRVQLDTVNTFDSPYLQTTTLTGKGLATWDVELLPATVNDTIRYYWRSIFEEELADDPQPWTNSTFTFIENGTEGWAQTEFDQFEELSLSSLSKREDQDSWIFAGTSTTIDVATFGDNHPSGGRPLDVTIEIDGFSLFSNEPNRFCATNSINAIAFNKDSGRPYLILQTPGQEFETQDPLNCGVTPQFINRFTPAMFSDVNTTGDQRLLRQYINGMDDGDRVLFFTIGSALFGNWDDETKADFGRVGVSTFALNTISSDSDPLIIFGTKGAAQGSADFIQGVPAGAEPDASTTEINFSTTINASTDSGTVFSPVIGPVSQWGRLIKSIITDPAEDEVEFEVRGRQLDGTEVTLFTVNSVDEVDLSSIDPNQYPFVRLYVNMVDRVSATPAQLDQWSVSYQGVPEGIITLQNDRNQDIELEEGEPFSAAFQFTNISEYDFQDNLNIRYTLTNQTSNEETTETAQIPPVAAGQTVAFDLPITTAGRIGLNDLEVVINLGDEIEQFTNNNVIRLESFFNVIRDEVSPSMDVTFDGVYIVDGDVISPTPLIEIELRDNNNFIFKTDTLGVEMTLTEICESGCEPQRISFSDPGVTFTPASENSNFRVAYQPDEFADGQYLFQVNATDASGNQAGIGPYEINFEVVNESTVTHFYPYPNPFSTSTRFVFTLTGSEIPDQIKIQIFTVSGKLVREITQDELGPLRIGNNVSEYAWDGRDEFGDLLANGTYLYRVQIQHSNGSSLGRRSTSKDKAFDNGFGKIVIIR
ncbi:C25 family cysteine peptidase [Roseivirga sp. 4D4]|uniref:putative type IX secretion system sortase PorU2 n=1 Tax=Roseivirga sp. 4D4 TaxID=1889784 RepID=UPI000B048B9B|nr:C25 family cysteine peptidase [Roseivirga sp. 4D4]